MESSVSTQTSVMPLKREITLSGTLRESTHPIQLLARNTSNGHFLSIDPVAIRIWSTRRQIKAYHVPPDNKIMSLKAMGAYYLSRYDMYAIVYSCKKTISEDDEEEQTMPQGGLIQFWYSSLLLSQEIAMDLPPIRDIVFNEAKLELILVDITGICNVMQIGHTYKKEKKLPHFQQVLSNPVTPQSHTPLHGNRNSPGGSPQQNPLFGISSASNQINLKLTCMRVQSFEVEDFEYFVEVGFIDDHKFMILAYTYMLCYSNPKSNNEKQESFDDDEVDEERYVHTHRFNFSFRSEARPCALLHLDGHVYAIGYGDGQVQVLLCDLERTYDANMSIDATILVETRAHILDPDKHMGRMGLSKGSWSSHMPGGHEIEFVSVGDDNKIIVWGVSQSRAVTVGESEFNSVYDSMGADSLTDVEMPEQQFSLHKIGVFDIIPDPTTSLNLRKYRKIWSGKKHLLSFDLVEDLDEDTNVNMNGIVLPSRRQVVCCLGGMLSFLEVHQLHRPISKYSYPKELIDVENGPLLCQFDDLISAQSEASPSMSENRGVPVTSRQYLTSLLVLQADILDIVDPDRGCLIKQLPILYLADSTKPLVSSIGKENEFLMSVKAREGTPSSCFYCSISEVIFVGYSSGGVNIVYPYDKTQTTFRIDTTGVHDCAIKKFTSFLQRVHREYVVFLMIGDAKGKLSVWTLSSRSEYELVWTSDAHAGEILTITSVCGMNHQGENVMQLERVVLTACRGGIVKAWVQHKSGKMMLTSFFKCDLGMSSFFGILVTKGNIAADNSFLDSQAGEHVDSVHLRSMDGSHPTTADKQEIRIVCLCGLVSGAIQGWILSSDTFMQGQQGGDKGFNESTLSNVSRIGAGTAAWTLSYSSSEISSICKMSNSRPNALNTSHFVFLCTAASGSTVLLQVSTAGELIKAASFFTLPFPRYRIIPYYQGDYSYDEYIAIGEKEIVEISPSINLSLSQRWHTYLKYSVNATGPYRKFKKVAPPMTRVAIKYDHHKGLDKSEAAKIKRLGYVPTDKLTRSIILGESAFDAAQSLDDLESKSPSRALSADIHFAKRDARLTELYLQAAKNSANEVTAATAMDIVLKWLTFENKSIELIQEAMESLDMPVTGLYQYLHVARLAAYVLAVNKKSLAESTTFKVHGDEPSFMTNTQAQQQHSIGSYYNMKSKKQRVMYNHLGEKIVNTKQLHSTLSGGIARGDGFALNESFAAYPSRLMEHTLPMVSIQRDTIMTAVPEFFAKYFSSKFLTPFTLNPVWDPRDSNYFDNRRVVRIARALLDMRCVQQHETVQTAMHSPEGSAPATMERLLCVYFERSFGHARLNVSHHKIVNYLEAVLQNRDVPIVQFLQRYMCPQNSSEHLTDLTLWQYCELRHYLFAKGDAIEGPAMVSEVHNPESVASSSSSSIVVKYLITRMDAKAALNEMFRLRGHYGVRCVQRLMSIVDGLPATDITATPPVYTPNYNNNATQKDTVDMEAFLTAVALEFNNIQVLLGEVHNLLFDKKHIPNFIVATSRDINTEISERIDVSQVKRNAAVQLSLDRLFALLSQFVNNDLKRTGTLDQITFRSVLVIAGQSILGFDSGRDAHRLVDECIKRYTGDRPTGGVCYADFLATLVAQIVLGQGGSTGLNGTDAMEALKTVRIGMGEQQAAALVTTIGLMQCPVEEDPYWTTGRSGATEPDDKSVISKAGFWSVDSGSYVPPNNMPHSLSTHSFTEGGPTAIDLGDINVPGAETKQMKRKVRENTLSIVPETTRNMSSSLSGEIINLDQFAGRTPYIKPRAPLIVNDVSMEGLDNAKAENDAKKAHLGKQGYSHGLREVYQDRASYVADGDESSVGFPTTGGAHSLAEYSVESLQSSNLKMSSYEVNLYLNEFKEEVDEKVQEEDGQTLDYQTRKMQALEAEYQRRKAIFDKEEEQVALMQEEERLRFIAKREQKEQEMIFERAAARAKERITLRFKRKEDNKRYARAEKGRALYKKAKEQEFKDLWAKNQEMLEKQLAEKERVRAIRAEKKAAEDAAKEIEREVAENILMRAEERRSHIVEKEIKEKEERERVVREAKEAKERADAEAKRRREAEIAEKKRIADEKKTAEVAREREETARRENYKLMKAEDINILTIPTPEELAALEEERLAKEAEEARIKEEEEAKARELAEAEEKAKESGGEVVIAADGSISVVENIHQEEKKELSPLEERMHDFLARIKVADNRNKSHPRKSEDKKQYFMPMLFANDIKYNSFSGIMNDEKGRLEEYSPSDRGKKPVRPQNPANFEEVDKMAKFKDIASAVQAHKIQLLQERLEMYGDNMGDIHPSEWTEVYKQDAVMWEEFFDAQEAILMARPPTPPPPIDEEAEFLKEMQKLDIGSNSEGVSEEKSSFFTGNNTTTVPKSLPVPDDNTIKNLPPLPLNTVARDTVHPRSYKYFQIELMDCAKLTLELRCIRGYADLLFASTELPTIANYEKRVQAGDYNKRTARLTYVPPRQGVFYVGVHSIAGCKFELWGSDTGQVPTTADPLLHVSNQLRKWEIIQNHTPEEVEMKLPQLMDEAEKIVNFENNMARATILSEYNEALGKGEIDHDEDEDYDEIDIMDTFISKAGRRIIKKDLEMYGQVIIDEDGEEEELDVNPNAHKELFSKPDLMNHQSYLDLVQGQKPLNTRERIQLVRSQRPKMATSVSLPELNPKAIRAKDSLSSANATPDLDLTKSSSSMTFALPPFLKKPIKKHDYTLVRFQDKLRVGSKEDKDNY